MGLALGLGALVLVSCAVPGGIYKGYEGPDRDLKEVAVLTWSSPAVTHIDGESVNERLPLFGGVRNTIAHLPPGEHVLRFRHSWKDLFLNDPEMQFVTLRAVLSDGKSYVISEAPCKSCDPFSVKFSIVDSATGATVAEETMLGDVPYGTAAKEAKERRRQEREDCEDRCSSKYHSCEWYDLKPSNECREDREDCEEDCKTFDDKIDEFLWPL